ncbi:MAG: hypothetical protein IJ189_08760 [Clostridia bacterium]|nr:hypothetical protein [Clostridia bacterium]
MWLFRCHPIVIHHFRPLSQAKFIIKEANLATKHMIIVRLVERIDISSD